MKTGMSKTTTQDESEREKLVALLTCICETPAPTFAEEVRAGLITELWREAGFRPHTDPAGNVVAEVPGGEGPRVLVAAHLDTVFPPDTELRVRAEGDRLSAPGIGDNSASLAVLTKFLQELAHHPRRPRLTAAATVGEEGLGNLRGIRELMKRAADFDMVVALDGHLGTIVDKSVGSRRFELHFHARGGHSWGDYPSPSAVHALGSAVHALTRLEVPREPRSSLNVGQVWGGTSVNAIAEGASFNLDLRSLDAAVLAALEAEAFRRVERAAKRHSVRVEKRMVGDRPAATVPNGALTATARNALQAAGVTARSAASSTDANAAMAAGLPAIAFGVYRGGDAHRLSEWLEPASLLIGYGAFAALLEGLTHAELKS